MKFTLSWLKEHLETDATLAEIVDKLTMIGLEVEAVDDRARFSPFVVARVVTAERHPDADKLKVLMVDTGEGAPVQVVCGAPNARAGLVGAFARPGAYIPGIDTTLAVGTIRGVESRGMMCSERELELSDDHTGIIDLPADAPVGASFAAYAGLDDPVIEIAITPNRPDALGVAGIARDLAAAGLGQVRPRPVEPVAGAFPCPVDVRLDFADSQSLCHAFGLRLVRGVRNGPSPQWLQRRLRAIGLRPINALVDITNFLTFDRNRPLHVFDAARVKGDLVVRRARPGETLMALDGRTYALDTSMCVIADDHGVESLAGVIGGEHSGCSEATTDVLIEAALWEPLNVAQTGRRLGISTDARYRNERGIDPAFNLPGLELATRLVIDLCGGEASAIVLAGKVPQPDRVVDFPWSEVRRLTGLDVPAEASRAILSRLGFVVEDRGATARVTVPSWRPDIEGKADLVEEVMRIHGVEAIAPQPMPSGAAVKGRILTTAQVRTRNARRALAARGMLEAVTWSFIPAGHAGAFGGGSPELRLANPIAAEMSDMRPSLLPGLISAAQRNADRGRADVALFEVSHVYAGDRPQDQKRVAGGVRRATARPAGAGRHWQGAAGPVEAFDAKADALSVLAACGLDAARVQVAAEAPHWYHPGRSGAIRLGPQTVLAHFGELHPATLEALDASGPLVGFEVFLDAIPEPRARPTRTKPRLQVSPYQAVTRDFAFVLDRDADAASLVRAAAGADRRLIAGVTVFDVFEGAALGPGRKSVAIEVTLQPTERTLTEAEIEAVSARIVDSVRKSTGGVLRA
ncbi:MAG: phenylalanine--tRNA ligase beta subunit [Alphaproteobacteria bacterium]|nr:MAG: phenylalanine--tRNA ligase beta subunit [Alphaproteobacteria bacterium]